MKEVISETRSYQWNWKSLVGLEVASGISDFVVVTRDFNFLISDTNSGDYQFTNHLSDINFTNY